MQISFSYFLFFFLEESIARRLAIAQTREKCYCQTSGNSKISGKLLWPDTTGRNKCLFNAGTEG